MYRAILIMNMSIRQYTAYNMDLKQKLYTINNRADGQIFTLDCTHDKLLLDVCCLKKYTQA